MLPNVVLFQGQDALNDSGLWETNGTGSGTFELAPAGTGAQGLSPSGITVLGTRVLFEGVDLGGHSGLWITDGTAVGTTELSSISGASSAGIAPSDLTVFGNEALFSGINASGQTGLWTTDGTANGTLELTGIIGAAAAGIAPTDLTVFNHQAMFTGTDTAGHLGLWVTNGTAGGTTELTGVASASSTGLDPSDLTVFNSEVLFNGVDANGLSGLWVTDGTVGGTHELVSGAGGAADPPGLNPTNITVYNNEVLFSGLDATGDMGLWVSNGTAAGTHELTGIIGADLSGLAPSDLTVYNGEVLFRGLDHSGQAALWITDGTVAGTHELTGIAGASTTGFGLDPSGFTVYGGVALFSGVDSSGNEELWQTNGSAGGTTEIGPVSGTQSMGLFPTDLTVDRNGGTGARGRGQRQLRDRSGAGHARRRAFRRRCIGSQPFRGHSQHQRRLRSWRRAERGRAPGGHCEPVQRRNGRPGSAPIVVRSTSGWPSSANTRRASSWSTTGSAARSGATKVLKGVPRISRQRSQPLEGPLAADYVLS